MELTESIIKDIFYKGAEWGAWNGANNYFDEPMNEEEVINSYFPRQKDVVDINKPLCLEFVQFELYSKDEYLKESLK